MIDYELEIKRTKLELIRWQSGDLKAVEINSRSKSAHLEETIDKLTGWIDQDKGLLVELDKLVLDNRIMYWHHCKGYTLADVAERFDYEYISVRQEHVRIMKRIDFMDASYSLINGIGKRLNARRFFMYWHLRKVYKNEQSTDSFYWKMME
jgi:hypothetical protein